jgi:hypothetical protein
VQNRSAAFNRLLGIAPKLRKIRRQYRRRKFNFHSQIPAPSSKLKLYAALLVATAKNERLSS